MSQDKQRRLPGTTDRASEMIRGGAQEGLKDQASVALRQQAGTGGNAAMAQQAAEGNVRRDAMLEFIAQRLAQARVLQAREVDQLARDRVWYDEVARGKGEFKLPDPTRWRHCATLYQRATEALAAGQVGRGAELLDQAVEAERAVYHSLPAQVQLNDWETAPMGTPDARHGVSLEMQATATHAHATLAVARDIQAVTQASPDAPYPQRQRPHKGWWDKGEDAGEKKPEAKGAPAAEAAGVAAAKAVVPKAEPKAEAKAPAKAATPEIEAPAPVKEVARKQATKVAPVAEKPAPVKPAAKPAAAEKHAAPVAKAPAAKAPAAPQTAAADRAAAERAAAETTRALPAHGPAATKAGEEHATTPAKAPAPDKQPPKKG